MATTPKPSDPAGQTEYRDIGSLLPYARNARTHTDEQVRQLAASITEWGWTMPVLIDEAGMILAGHARVRAAALLALTQVPVVVAKGWSEPKKRAYILADNQLAQNAGWDLAMRLQETTDLLESGFECDLIGFSPINMAEMFGGVNSPSEEWAEMPDCTMENVPPIRTIIVHFESHNDVNDFTKLIGQAVTDKTKFIYHPQKVRNTPIKYRYEGTDGAA